MRLIYMTHMLKGITIAYKENPALPSLGESKVVGCTYAGGKNTTKLYFLTVQVKTSCVLPDMASFGPNSQWDRIFFADFYREGKWDGTFDVYELNTDDINNYKVKVGRTLLEQKMQGRSCIRNQLSEGAEMVLVCGGMSVDPDDVTPVAIKGMGAELITYGAPILPGAMFMLAYLGAVPIIGLPGCVMYSKKSIFDLLAPRMLTGERLSRLDIVKLGLGGLCLECPVCTYPHCSFGK